MSDPRARLDTDTIVATALDLLDEVGLDHLSTRALATRLGVKSPALYWHFASKADLVAAMAERMGRDLGGVPAELTDRPTRPTVEQWMVARAQAFRASLLSRRDGARVHAGTRPPDDRLVGVEAQIAVLRAVGLSAADAARATLAVSRFVVGWALEEQSGRVWDPPEIDPSVLPGLAEAADVLDDPERQFDWSLRRIVSGLLAS